MAAAQGNGAGGRRRPHTCLPIGEGPSRSIRVDGQQRDWHVERQDPFSFAKRMLKGSQHSTKPISRSGNLLLGLLGGTLSSN